GPTHRAARARGRRDAHRPSQAGLLRRPARGRARRLHGLRRRRPARRPEHHHEGDGDEDATGPRGAALLRERLSGADGLGAARRSPTLTRPQILKRLPAGVLSTPPEFTARTKNTYLPCLRFL